MNAARRLPTTQVVAFALPAFISAVMHGPTGGILSGVYAKFFGLSLAFIATAQLVCRLFDAVTDPLIGYLSDRTRTRIGRRKPWLIAGGLLAMLAVYFLFVPGESASAAYFLVWYLVLYLAWTMSEIPSNAWFAELTHDYAERARIVTFRTVSALLGALAFAAAPLLPFLKTTEMTPEVLGVVAWVVVLTVPLFVGVALVYVPTGVSLAAEQGPSLRDLLASLRRNRPFWLFCSIFLLAGLAGGMSGALGFLFLDTYLLIGDKIAWVTMPAILVTMVSMPVWLMIIRRIGKQKAWALGSVFGLIVALSITLIEPGPSAFVPYLVLTAIGTLGLGAAAVAPAAMMADVIDYDILKTGVNRAGSYFATLMLLTKLNVAVGAALGFLLIDLFGYDATQKAHDATAVFGMKLAIAYLPALLYAPSILLMWKFPIDERRQEIIRRRIESRAARAAQA